MKKLSFALACAASAALFAAGQAGFDATIDSIDFESYAENFTGLSGKMDDGTAGQGPTDSHWLYEGSENGDGSTVKAYGNDTLPVPAGSLSGTPGSQYLELSTEGGTLWRSFATLADATTLGAAQTVGTAGVYIDTMVQFTPTEDGGTPEVGSDDKIAIWLNVDSQQNTTNLCVRASLIEDLNNSDHAEPTTFVLNPTDPTNPVKAGTWYRLTIKAIADVDQRMAKNAEAYQDGLTGFQIYLDGQLLSSATSSFANSYMALATAADQYGWLNQATDAALISFLQSGSVFASLKGFETTSTVQGIGFKGSGAIDELVFKSDNPFPANIDFTVTIPTGATATYTVGSGSATTLPASGAISGPAGSAYTLTITLANGTVATKTGTIEADGSADYSTVDWSWYLAGAGTEESPYVVPNATELRDLANGVAAGLASAGTYFALTADIDMTDEAAFPGIGQAGVENIAAAANTYFQGTFDGAGHTISNLKMINTSKGTGLFNTICGNAVIKNLTVDTVTYDTIAVTKMGGGMLVGLMSGGTITNCVTAGSNGSAENPITYNAAGIVNRIETRLGKNTVVDCTNSADIYSTYSKIAGICPIIEFSGATADVDFINCVNTGNITGVGDLTVANSLTGKVPGVDGCAGILAYTQSAVSGKCIRFKNCKDFGTLRGSCCGGLIGWGNAVSIVDAGGNQTKASVPYMNKGSGVTGFAVAIIADEIATYYATFADGYAAAAAGDTLKLYANATVTGSLVINKAITIDGNGKTLTSGSGQQKAIDVNGVTVTFKNVTLDGSGATKHTVNVYNGGAVFENVVTVAAPNSSLNINNSTVTVRGENTVIDMANGGWYAAGIDVGGTLTIENGTFNGKVQAEGPTQLLISGGTIADLALAGSNPNTVIAVSGGLFGIDVPEAFWAEGLRSVASTAHVGYWEMVADFLDGTGTELDPFVIDSVRHLKLFRSGVNDGTLDKENQYFIQTADIDLKGETWTGIGTGLHADDPANHCFCGHYDGQNHVIQNLVVGTPGYAGLFSCIDGGSVKNLKVLNATSKVGATAVSVALGDVEPPTGKSFVAENVTVSGTVSGPHNVGGLASWTAGNVSFISCTNLATCTGNKHKVGGFTPIHSSGIVGPLLITNCCNKGAVSLTRTAADGTFAAGGFVGYSQGSQVITIVDSVNEGAVSGLWTSGEGGTAMIGGIFGYDSGSCTITIRNCSNTGAVTANVVGNTKGAVVGGIAAQVASGTKLHLEDVVSAGAVSATVTENLTSKVGAFVGQGYAYNEGTQAGLWLTGKALTALPQFADVLATVGGYTGTWAEGDYTVYGIAAAGYPTYIGDDADKKAWYDTWKGLYGADTESAYEAAFLLNVDPTSAQALADAKAAFAISSIEPDGKGGWTVTVAEAYGDGDRYGNGTIEIRGCVTLDGTYTAPAPSGAKFFKAFLK